MAARALSQMSEDKSVESGRPVNNKSGDEENNAANEDDDDNDIKDSQRRMIDVDESTIMVMLAEQYEIIRDTEREIVEVIAQRDRYKQAAEHIQRVQQARDVNVEQMMSTILRVIDTMKNIDSEIAQLSEVVENMEQRREANLSIRKNTAGTPSGAKGSPIDGLQMQRAESIVKQLKNERIAKTIVLNYFLDK